MRSDKSGEVPSRQASRAENVSGKIQIISKQIQFEAETAGLFQIDDGLGILVCLAVISLGASLRGAQDPLEIQI